MVLPKKGRPMAQKATGVFNDVTEEQLKKIRKDFPTPPFNVDAKKKSNGKFDVTITKN